MLELLPGVTDRVAKRIVEHRGANGPFANLAAAERMPGMNKRVWEQAAGFLRVYGGDEPLDATGVHPQQYDKARALLEAASVTGSDFAGAVEKLAALDLDTQVDATHSRKVIDSIVAEFKAVRLEPRGAFQEPERASALTPIDEPKVGMKVDGLVTNAASFGVFIDIGAEQDGLLHISQLPDEMVANDRPKVKPGSKLTVFVTNFDSQSGKLSLSTREPREPSRRRRAASSERGASSGRERRGGPRTRRDDRAPLKRTFGPDKEQQARARKEVENMSLNEKLTLLGDKFRTKV